MEVKKISIQRSDYWCHFCQI